MKFLDAILAIMSVFLFIIFLMWSYDQSKEWLDPFLVQVKHTIWFILFILTDVLVFFGALSGAIHIVMTREGQKAGVVYLVMWVFLVGIAALIIKYNGTDWIPFFDPNTKSVFSDGWMARGISGSDAFLFTIGIGVDIGHALLIRLFGVMLLLGVFLIPILSGIGIVQGCRWVFSVCLGKR